MPQRLSDFHDQRTGQAGGQPPPATPQNTAPQGPLDFLANVLHAHPSADGYHPGLSDSESPGSSWWKGLRSGVGEAATPTKLVTAAGLAASLPTFGASIPVAAGVVGGASALAEALQAARDDPKAPQSMTDAVYRPVRDAALTYGGAKALQYAPAAWQALKGLRGPSSEAVDTGLGIASKLPIIGKYAKGGKILKNLWDATAGDVSAGAPDLSSWNRVPVYRQAPNVSSNAPNETGWPIRSTEVPGSSYPRGRPPTSAAPADQAASAAKNAAIEQQMQQAVATYLKPGGGTGPASAPAMAPSLEGMRAAASAPRAAPAATEIDLSDQLGSGRSVAQERAQERFGRVFQSEGGPPPRLGLTSADAIPGAGQRIPTDADVASANAAYRPRAGFSAANQPSPEAVAAARARLDARQMSRLRDANPDSPLFAVPDEDQAATTAGQVAESARRRASLQALKNLQVSPLTAQRNALLEQ